MTEESLESRYLRLRDEMAKRYVERGEVQAGLRCGHCWALLDNGHHYDCKIKRLEGENLRMRVLLEDLHRWFGDAFLLNLQARTEDELRLGTASASGPQPSAGPQTGRETARG